MEVSAILQPGQDVHPLHQHLQHVAHSPQHPSGLQRAHHCRHTKSKRDTVTGWALPCQTEKIPLPTASAPKLPVIPHSPAPLMGSVVYGPSRCPSVPDIPPPWLWQQTHSPIVLPKHRLSLPAQIQLGCCSSPQPAVIPALDPGFFTCLSGHKLLTCPPDPACPECLWETNLILKH